VNPSRYRRVALLLGLASLPGAATARHHLPSHHATTHHASTHHATGHHATESRHTGKAEHDKPAHDAAAPAGVTRVPAGGLKTYCPGRSSQMLVRKMTQGNGTTVTVICR
jgi:hypothetical protein